MDKQKLYSYVRRACQDYHMLSSGDKVAVGLSGGKDSLTLLQALAGMRKFYPETYELVAITVDLGYEGFDLSPLISLCEALDVPYYVVKTQIGEIVKVHESEGSYCSLCAKLRKGALNQKALELGCNKIAYAHHMDDMIETMFMSLIYEGQFYVFPPVTPMEDSGLTVIRPLMYVPEAHVIGFMNKYPMTTIKNPCPYDGHTKREYVKNLVRQLNQENPGVKKKFFHAIINGHIYDWPS